MFKNLFSRKKDPKVFVIGLDCAPPEFTRPEVSKVLLEGINSKKESPKQS